MSFTVKSLRNILLDYIATKGLEKVLNLPRDVTESLKKTIWFHHKSKIGLLSQHGQVCFHREEETESQGRIRYNNPQRSWILHYRDCEDEDCCRQKYHDKIVALVKKYTKAEHWVFHDAIYFTPKEIDRGMKMGIFLAKVELPEKYFL